MNELPLIECSSCNIKRLVSSLTQFSCERISPPMIIGEKILLDQVPLVVTQITIAGWYRLIGNSRQDYLILQVLNSPTENLINISYNPIDEAISSRILNYPQPPIVLTGMFKNLLKDNWFFMKVGIRLDEDYQASPQSYIYFLIQTILSQASPIYTYSIGQLLPNSIIQFDNNQFQVFYGQQANYPQSSACAKSKIVTVFIGKANHSSQGPEYETSPQEMYLEASLELQVNFSVLSNVPNIQYSTAKNNRNYVGIDKRAPYSISTQNYETFLMDESVTAGLFNFEENNGITIQADIQIKGGIQNFESGFLSIWNPTYYQLLYRSIYKLEITTDGIIYYISDSFLGIQSIQYPVQLDTWYRFTIVFTIVFDQIVKKVFINNVLAFNDIYLYQFIGKIQFSIFNFTSTPYNSLLVYDRKILVKTMKAYKGTFYETCSNCSMQMDIIQGNDCLMCASNTDYIQQGQDYTCESSCNSQFSSSSASWQACEWISTPQTCPIYQLKQFQHSCDCANGKFYNGFECQDCPEYCITCSSATKCKQFYAPRGINGQCNPGIFDDGKKCIDQFMKIQNRQNDQFQFKFTTISCSTPNFSSLNDLIIKNKAFQIGNGSNSFFISFNFMFTIANLLFGQQYTIIFMEDVGTHIFSLIAQVDQINAQNVLEMHLQVGQDKMFIVPIENNQNIWIGIYTNLDKVTLIVKYDNSPIQYYHSNIINKPKTVLTDPSLIFGKISPVSPTSNVFCGNFNNENNWILEGHLSMFSFSKILQLQSEVDMQRIVDFNFSEYKAEYFSSTTVQNKINPNQYIDFLFPNQKFNKIQGIQIDSSSSCTIVHSGELISSPFAFQLVIHPQIFFPIDTLIFSINYPVHYLITFGLIQNRFELYPKLEICIFEQCQQLKYARFQYYKPNYLFVKITQQEKLKSVQFSVILNYKSEDIEIFQDISSYFLPQFWSFTIGYPFNALYKSIYTINNFQLYQGGFYYIDYDLNDPCFLYINRSNMECILPKQGFAINGNKVIPNNQCNQGRPIDQTILFYNPFTTKCQDSELYKLYCAEISYLNLNTCIRCIDPQMILQNNCSCPEGTYFDSTSLMCKACSPHCKTCVGNSGYCLTCPSQEQFAPNCECLNPNQYQDSNFQCQNCNVQCAKCQESPNYCTVCNEGRINPPTCYCNPRIHLNKITEQIQNDCTPIECNDKCQTCEYREDNCILCKGDRINPPVCSCSQGYYEHPNEDKLSYACRKCNYVCSSCYGPTDKNCLGCKYNLLLINGECLCENGSERIVDDEISCYNFINVNYHLKFENNSYEIQIEFEKKIDFLNKIISETQINNIINLSISEIPQEYYEIRSYKVPRDNQLILEIGIKKSLQTSYGQVHFKQTNLFKNKQYKVVLDPIYKSKTFQFRIGPYMMVIENRQQQIINAFKKLTPSNQDLIKFIRNLQFLFYVLNSIQPTAMFLLIKIDLPINFYTFLQLFGTFVYKDMPDYQVNQFEQRFTLGLENVDQYVKTTGNIQFDRLGFRDSLLVNCEIIFYKYLVIFTVIIAFKILKCLYLPHQRFQGRVLKIQKIISFLIVRVSQENEVNLLMTVFSLCIQIKNAYGSNWLSRWSIYSSFFIGSIFFYSCIWFFKYYNNSSFFKENQHFFDLFLSRLKQDQFEKSLYLKNYHFIYLLKKILIVFLIFFLVDHPMYLCCICGIFNLFTAIMTFYLRPYKYLLQTLTKAFGDIFLAVTWLFMILFYKFNQDIRRQTVLNDSHVESFLDLGFFASLSLIGFNLFFLINFIFENIILPIYQYFQKKKKKTQLVFQKKSIQKILNNKEKVLEEKIIEETDYTYKKCDNFVEFDENNNQKILIY